VDGLLEHQGDLLGALFDLGAGLGHLIHLTEQLFALTLHCAPHLVGLTLGIFGLAEVGFCLCPGLVEFAVLLPRRVLSRLHVPLPRSPFGLQLSLACNQLDVLFVQLLASLCEGALLDFQFCDPLLHR
jgi:hypothetical protein